MKRWLLTLAVLAFTSPAFAQSVALTRATYAKDADTQQRVVFLTEKVAFQVFNENAATCCGATEAESRAQHDTRLRFVRVVLSDPASIAYRVTLAVLTDYSITLASTDAQVEAVIVAQWNAYAEAMKR